MAQPLYFIEKSLRDDDHKDEPTLDRTPATRGGLEGSWTRKETESTVVVRRQTDRILGDRNEEKSLRPPESYGYMPPRKPIATKGNHRPTRTCRGLKKKVKALRVLPSEKASKGVFYSSASSRATVGYRY